MKEFSLGRTSSVNCLADHGTHWHQQQMQLDLWQLAKPAPLLKWIKLSWKHRLKQKNRQRWRKVLQSRHKSKNAFNLNLIARKHGNRSEPGIDMHTWFLSCSFYCLHAVRTMPQHAVIDFWWWKLQLQYIKVNRLLFSNNTRAKLGSTDTSSKAMTYYHFLQENFN